MKAREAKDGQKYSLGKRASRPDGYSEAVCNGWNGLGTGILFLVFDEWGKRKMILVPPDEEIK